MHTTFKLALGTAAILAAFGASAQTFPAAGKSITIVVPFSAGGPTDRVARDLAEALRKPLGGATVVIDNSAGAGSTIGAAKVARAQPDGYTLLLNHIGMATIPTLYRKLPFNVLNDFEFLGIVNDVPMTIISRPTLEAKNYKELASWIAQNKEKVNLGHSGLGSAGHLCGLMFQHALQSHMTPVAYKGAAPAITDMLAGQVDLQFGAINSLLPHIRTGKLRALAVGGTRRASLLADVPTMAEAGLPQYDSEIWLGLAAPAGTPAAVIKRINADVTKILNEPEVKEKLAEQGIETRPSTPQEMTKLVEKDTARWASVIKSAGIKAD